MTALAINIHTGVTPYPPDLLDKVLLHFGTFHTSRSCALQSSYVGQTQAVSLDPGASIIPSSQKVFD
jgi:hypothetical protein